MKHGSLHFLSSAVSANWVNWMGHTDNGEYQTSMSGSTTLKVCSNSAIATVIDFSQLMYCMGFIYLFIFLNFCWTHVHFWGHWYLCFGLLVTSPLGFKARLGSLIRTLWRRMWCTFPEIHLWCNTSACVYGQHGSQSLYPHACLSRGRMLDLNHRPSAWQVDALTTRPQRPGVWDLLLLSQSHHVNTNIRGFRE